MLKINVMVLYYTCTVVLLLLFSAPGQLNVCSQELLVSANWQSLWCVVRRGSLECFREMGDDTAVLSLLLTGVTIDNAASGTKREFALRLLRGDKEVLSLEVSLQSKARY